MPLFFHLMLLFILLFCWHDNIVKVWQAFAFQLQPLRWDLVLFSDIERYGFETWWSQTNDLRIDTCSFLARRSALLE